MIRVSRISVTCQHRQGRPLIDAMAVLNALAAFHAFEAAEAILDPCGCLHVCRTDEMTESYADFLALQQWDQDHASMQ